MLCDYWIHGGCLHYVAVKEGCVGGEGQGGGGGGGGAPAWPAHQVAQCYYQCHRIYIHAPFIHHASSLLKCRVSKNDSRGVVLKYVRGFTNIETGILILHNNEYEFVSSTCFVDE